MQAILNPRWIDRLPAQLALHLPNGHRIGRSDACVRLQLQNWTSLARVRRGQWGALASDYVQGKVDLIGPMREIMRTLVELLPPAGPPSRPTWPQAALQHVLSAWAHTRARDSAQIAFHYDLSDDFYALWLDPRRVYSCAYFAQDGMDLAQAQEAKLEHICRKLLLRPGDRFLDVGAGWGALLLWAAEHYGVQATGITLSRNQWAHVNRMIQAKGLQGRVRMELIDYRDIEADKPFDKIASVGMFEHVGRARLPGYFGQLRDLLRPGGLLMNHGITAAQTEHDRLGAGLGDFIETYIFPGGQLLHASEVLGQMANAGLEMVDTENLRPHYARTLWAWSDALEDRLPQALAVLSARYEADSAAKILRAYRLYLAGCAVAFEQGWIALHQMLASRPSGHIDGAGLRGAQSDHPFRRDHMYPAASAPQAPRG